MTGKPQFFINPKFVMKVHSIVCIIIGVIALIIPHRLQFINLFQFSNHPYNHLTHEHIRLYGCLTLSIGWFVWSTKSINDGRLQRAVSEAFSVCYILQSIVMLRAQFTNPTGHSLLHWFVAIVFLCVGSLYAYIRMFYGIKSFQLPGMEE